MRQVERRVESMIAKQLRTSLSKEKDLRMRIASDLRRSEEELDECRTRLEHSVEVSASNDEEVQRVGSELRYYGNY